MAKNTFPSSTLFHYPILLLLADGKEHSRDEMAKYEIKMLSISEDNQKVSTPKGINKVMSWTNFAIADLKNAECIEHSGIGYIITAFGLDFFNSHKGGFVANELRASASYCKYKKIKSDGNTKIRTTPKAQVEPNDTSEVSEDGVVYILTNPAFKTYYIKIGYTTNISDRLRELYNTSVPHQFKVYALLKTNKYKQAEKMIHSACKASRIGDDREFFMLNPDEALRHMKAVAELLETTVIVYDDKGNEKKTFNYSK